MILDDGFQDKSIYKSLNILCFKSDLMAGTIVYYRLGL